jgi:hypothetical protein
MLEAGITVDSISEELFCIDRKSIGPRLWADLDARGFDRCGVKDNGRVVGYVEHHSSDDGATQIQEISVNQLVAETTPVWQVMQRLAETQWLFVLTQRGPTGIVTTTDLAKQPARLLMFGIISLLEMTMLELIRQAHPNNTWCGLISKQRLEKANDLLVQRQRKGQDIDLADCLQWSEKAMVCAQTEAVMLAWGFPSKNKCERLLSDVQSLRDQLAHSQHPAPDGDWGKVAYLLHEVDRLIAVNMSLLNK